MKPYYSADGITVYHGDCREFLAWLPAVDLILTDPPYGDTSLEWDDRASWSVLRPVEAPQLWSFGSIRFWMESWSGLRDAGWTYAQEIVWEKHNGSSFHADRFRRVHEIA